MTSWNELRTVALVGTNRRPLPETRTGSLLDGFKTDLGAEHAALQAAALLAIGRRVSSPVSVTTPPAAATVSAAELAGEKTAPHAAVQLLELMLTGNTGPGTMSDSLLEQWYTMCAEHELVVPHRLLVPVLDGATTTSRLRDHVRAVIGTRGRWLAAQRDKWSWAAISIAMDSEAPAQQIDLDELLEMSADQRDATLKAARAVDAAAGRQLIAEACTKLDAASRARALACLHDHVNADDEELLEAALDDRSKGVRTVAIALLNAITTSARSARLTRQLEPLITKGGRLRATIDVTYPAPPEGEQLRDLPPNGHGVIEQQWFDALIAGTPLSWWEDTLGMTPAKIVRTKSNYADELLGAWSAAALTQQNIIWLEQLFEVTKQPELLAYIGDVAAADAFLDSTEDTTSLNKQALLLQAVPGPWTSEFSRDVLAWVRTANDGKGALARMNQFQTVLADRLHADTQAALSSWLESVRDEEHQPLQRALRNVIQQLSFRTSIDKAFS